MSIKRVILGISGGVDSAVAGIILKKLGYDVTGVFMKNWDEKDEFGYCSSDREAEDAELICKKLNIPFHIVNFVQEYWNEVFCYLLQEYQSGRTPNPDIYCNNHVKFKHFLKYSKETFDADCIATGHYARTSFGNFLEHFKPDAGARLLKAVDFVKDQTFFLSQVPQEGLKKTMFPLGDLTKSEVKNIACQNGLLQIASKEESTGICFIGNRKFQSFISQYINDKPGDFVDIDSEEKVGEHRGFHYWTIGQKAKIPGYPWRYYISSKEVDTNIIYVARNGSHLSLFADSVVVGPFKWIHSAPEKLRTGEKIRCQFRFQHTKPLVTCSVALLGSMKNFDVVSQMFHNQPDLNTDGCCYIELDTPLRALTAGQFAVLYDGDECLGSAPIKLIGPSLQKRMKNLRTGGNLFNKFL